MMVLIGWIIYGFVVGLLAKILHPGDDPVGILPTIAIGVAGSFVGGFLNWLIGFGGSSWEPSGVIMGVVGGVVFLAIFRYIKLKWLSNKPRNFWTGK